MGSVAEASKATRHCRYCGEYVASGAEHVCLGVVNQAIKKLEVRVQGLEHLERRLVKLEQTKRRGVPLSLREKRTLELIAEGKLNKEIAQEFHVSDQTVKNFVTQVFNKLGVRNRTEAAMKWREIEHGIV